MEINPLYKEVSYMYDAKLETKDEELKYETIKDRMYFERIPNRNLLNTPTSYVPIDDLFE